MNTIPTPPANDELDPSLAALLRGSDPCDAEHERAMARSRAHTADIPDGAYLPVISQRLNPAAALMPADAAAKRNAGRGWAAILALAAVGAVIAGVAALGPWGGQPQPAAPPPVVPSPASLEFNPDDDGRMNEFAEAGGKRVTGWLRSALPTDPPALHRTGWLFNTIAVAGSGEVWAQAQDPWVPIDLGSRDTSLLDSTGQGGILAVVATTDGNLESITPVPGPYGIMFTDAKRLATGSVSDARSLMTPDGVHLREPDGNYNGTVLAQFATFEMTYSYTAVPPGPARRFNATAFHSHTNSEALSCITASTGSGEKILAFPEGATASVSIAEPTDLDEPVADYPLRIMPLDGWFDDAGDDSMFLLDTAGTPQATFTGFPTATMGTCGGYSGEVVQFEALAQ